MFRTSRLGSFAQVVSMVASLQRLRGSLPITCRESISLVWEIVVQHCRASGSGIAVESEGTPEQTGNSPQKTSSVVSFDCFDNGSENYIE